MPMDEPSALRDIRGGPATVLASSTSISDSTLTQSTQPGGGVSRQVVAAGVWLGRWAAAAAGAVAGAGAVVVEAAGAGAVVVGFGGSWCPQEERKRRRTP